MEESFELPPPCVKLLHLLSGEWQTTGVARDPTRGPCPNRDDPFPLNERPTFYEANTQFHRVPTMADASNLSATLEYAQHAWRKVSPKGAERTASWLDANVAKYFRRPKVAQPRERAAEREGLVHSSGFLKCLGPTRLQWTVAHVPAFGTEVLEGDVGVEPDESYAVELRSTWLSNLKNVDESVHILLVNPVGTQMKRRVFTAIAGQDRSTALALHVEEEATVKNKGYDFSPPEGETGIPSLHRPSP